MTRIAQQGSGLFDRISGIVAGAMVLAVALGSASIARAAEDLLIADFEGEDYAGWTVEGEAFGDAPARGELPGQMSVTGFLGRGLVNSFVGGDGSTGRLVSPAFAIQRPVINFLAGGGAHSGETCINLRVDDKVVRTATGPNETSGGSEELDWYSWDVRDLIGKRAVIEIVDTHTGGWGHINVDHIHQSDVSRMTAPRERVIVAEQRYLHLPVKTGGKKQRVQVLHDNEIVRDFEIELAEERPDFWVSCDLAPWKGQQLTVRASRLAERSTILDRLRQSNDFPVVGFDTPDRPRIHFTAPRGWLNDPNGLVYLDGEWHLFYQHNPYGWNWGNMHWGHATSRDLVHWKHHPIALTPKKFGDWAFSGSAVVDTENTSGWKTGPEPVLVAAYTSTGRGECIVYSNDRGRTWTEFEGNPVVTHEGRDPRLLWHAKTKRWVMAIYREADDNRWIVFYTSPDLKTWEYTSRIADFFECPDLFELPVDGSEESKWVLYGASGEYILGEFDGREFHKESGKHRLWHGNFYAAQTFSNVSDGRRIQIGWGQGIDFPGRSFNQQMTIPVELRLVKTEEGPRMAAMPVRELREAAKHDLKSTRTVDGVMEIPSLALPIDLELRCEAPAEGTLRLELWGEPITVDFGRKTIAVCDVPAAPLNDSGEEFRLRAIADTGSIEVFVGEGLTAISAKARPRLDSPAIFLMREGAPLKVELRECWNYQDGR
jgi:fructan beta-fructosidase